MEFYRKKIHNLTIEEMNSKLAELRDIGYRINYNEYTPETKVGYRIYLQERIIEIDLILKEGGHTVVYRTRKDGKTPIHDKTGMDAFICLQRMSKGAVHTRLADFSASPLLWYREEYNNTRNYCYSYDINSAYAWAMIQDIPDTDKPLGPGYVEEGQAGFTVDGNIAVYYADYRFPLIESPFKRFVDRFYKMKCECEGDEKRLAKDMLVYSVGYMQKKNPYLRAWIVGQCNDRINKLIRKYKSIIFANTDSVVSLERIPELDEQLSNELGGWKLEKQGYFAFKGFNYQWNESVPSIRGVEKIRFYDGFDILVDELPPIDLPYYYNKETKQICLKKDKAGQ